MDCFEQKYAHIVDQRFNSEQGSQFVSEAFTDVLKRAPVKISTDGQWFAFDNFFVERLRRKVNHEDIYLDGYRTMGKLTIRLMHYMIFYNTDRPDQALYYKTSSAVYETGTGGRAKILNKNGSSDKESGIALTLYD